MKKCFSCEKEIISGKYYNFRSGKLGGKLFAEAFDSNFFCPSCANKEQKENFFGENLIKIEWEIGNKTDEEILEFEEKWQSCKFTEEVRKKDANITLNLLQQDKQALEPYLQKENIVEKSFGGKIKGYGGSEMAVYYLFDKSAREGNYCQEVVEKTVAKILGVEKLNQKINTTTTGTAPGVPGYTGGKLEIDDNLISYCWIDDLENICRRIRLDIYDQKLAFNSLMRSLQIKERELTAENPDKNKSGSDSTLHSDDKQRILKICFIIGGIVIIVFLFFFLLKRHKKNK